MRFLSLLVGVSLALCACSPRPAVNEYSIRQRAALTPGESVPLDVTPSTSYRVALPREASAWTLDGGTAEHVGYGSAKGLALVGGARHELRVPAEIDPERVNWIQLEIAAEADMTVRAALSRRTREVDGNPTIAPAHGFELIRAGVRRRVELTLHSTRDHREPYDTVLIQANGDDLDWTLLAIELGSRPLEGGLPDPNDPPQLIDAGGESRLATGLSHRRALIGVAVAPANGVLTFSYAWPTGGARPAKNASIVLKASASMREVARRRYPFPTDEGGWHHARFDLARISTLPVQFTFELDTTDFEPAACALGEVHVTPVEAEPQTVLLVTSGAHRADHTSIARSGVPISTPNIDGVARAGVLFTDARASSDRALPSLAGLMTARHPRDAGLLDNRTSLADEADTLAEHFARAGYRTWAATSARHVSPPWSGLDQGFDRMSWPAFAHERDARAAVQQILDWLPDAEGEPLFVWLHVHEAHPSPMTGEVADYAEEIARLDHQLAPLLKAPRMRKALIAITADHGVPLEGDREGLYTHTLQVPLILRYPDATPGLRIRERVRQLDLGRTLLALSGVDSKFPGRDLREGVDAGDPIFAIARGGEQLAVTTGQWHLIESANGYELFDLSADPRCERDVASEEAETAQRLRGLLDDWNGRPVESLADPVPENAEEELTVEAFGY